ncbi:hypothetical protein Misp01_81330 [Microtetraspora sp. NBRC 13810]|uniref:TOMM precursor leader peptide-binding protein n=1 Tax=Microtetraspora sp. NBRC 13810 TaxID=3030990 RepID=UPI0024A37E9D|nr:TOMM precursor leader peptide-binding protein [Microtetraspora sp. NBRC 13810]GLW13005.1 hypothetical protein Misp01_81330 [Microtetraspora sp. NBRC 13810]
MPAAPRLLTGLAVVAAGDGLVVTGTPRRQVFRGEAATRVLPRLLPLLDGVRDRGQICDELDLSPRQLAKAISLLDRSGLLDHPGAEPVPPRLPAAVVSYYGRVKDLAGYRGTGEVTALLAGSRVAVFAHDAVGARVGADLTLSGAGAVSLVPGTADGDRTLAETDFVVAVGTGPDAAQVIASAAREGAAQGVPVLRVLLAGGHLEVGPYLFPGFSTCVECLERSRREAAWDGEPSDQETPDALEFAAGVAAAETVSMITKVAGMRLGRRVARISLRDFTTEHFVAAPYPECAHCGAGRALSPAAAAIEQYEWWTQRTPAVLTPREAGRGAAAERVAGLEGERPRLSSHPRRPLPGTGLPVGGTFGREEAGQRPETADEEVLGELLRRVGGLRRDDGADRMQRWTPTGGNLGSVELYLLREAGFPGLPGTLFRYDDLGHALTAVRPDAVTAAGLLAGTDLRPAGYSTVVVLVAAHARNAGKYQHSHRLVHLDAGCAVTQLDTVAAGYGRHTRWARSWDERVAEVLRLDRRDQFVTGIAGIGDGHDRRDGGESACL